MNSYERVMTALQHKEPDRVPVYPILCGVMRKLTGVSYAQWSQDAQACAEGFLRSVQEYVRIMEKDGYSLRRG